MEVERERRKAISTFLLVEIEKKRTSISAPAATCWFSSSARESTRLPRRLRWLWWLRLQQLRRGAGAATTEAAGLAAATRADVEACLICFIEFV